MATDDGTPLPPPPERRPRSLDPSAPAPTIDLAPSMGWTRARRALAVAGAFAIVVSAAGLVAQFGSEPPELVTVPAGPPSVRIRAEQAVLALEAALDRAEPAEIEAAAIELRQSLSRLPEPERDVVAEEATLLLAEAERALDELPSTPASTAPRTSTTLPATSSSPPTTTPGTATPSSTVPSSTTTTTVGESTTTTTTSTTTTVPDPTADDG